MKIVDLSLPLYTGMPVYPGDPPSHIEPILTLEKDNWNMSRIEINSHDATHVNVPYHVKAEGKSLDDYAPDDFIGESRLYKSDNDIIPGVGVIFSDTNIDRRIADIIAERRPKFVGLASELEFDEEIERYLLMKDIISFENLCNTSALPDSFVFHGVPLPIRKGDGSPVRAYAIIP